MEAALSDFPDLEPSLLSRDPWVLAFDRFLSDDEVDALLAHGEGNYEPSTVTGGQVGRGADVAAFVPEKAPGRTSWNFWCRTTECLANPAVQRIARRVERVSQVPANHSEFIQLLRYLPCPHVGHAQCQYYSMHHDTIHELTGMQPGPRVYTFLMYLSDVEEGGGTVFSRLNFTVAPRKGRAILWPSTLEEHPFEQDERTYHEALPVTRGVKFAANFWIHQHDYRGPHERGCTPDFAVENVRR